MSRFNENINDIILVLIKHYVNVEEVADINMHGGTINGYRGYKYDTGRINSDYFHTTKRSSLLQFSFGNCRSQRKTQFIVPEIGCQTVYQAIMSTSFSTKKLLAYRSGTGSVVMLTSTRKNHDKKN